MTLITRDHLTVERSTSNWDGPLVTATFAASLIDQYAAPDRIRAFQLKSTDGLEPIRGAKPGIHVFEVFDEHRDEWYGAFPFTDMERAIDGLVEMLNDMNTSDRASWAVMSARSELRDALEDFDAALESGPHPNRDFRADWERVKAAIVAIDMALAGVITEGAAE